MNEWMNKWPNKGFLKTPTLWRKRRKGEKESPATDSWCLKPLLSHQLARACCDPQATLSLASHWCRRHQLIKQQKRPGRCTWLSIRTVHLECSAQICKYLWIRQNSPSDFWFWEKGAPTNLESQAGGTGRGIRRTLPGKVSSSLQALMRFSIVPVPWKRVGSQVILGLPRVRQIISPFGGLREAVWLAQNHPARGAGIWTHTCQAQSTPCPLQPPVSHGGCDAWTTHPPLQASRGGPQFPCATLTKYPELPGRNPFTLKGTISTAPGACEAAKGLKQYIKKPKRFIGSKFFKENFKIQINKYLIK